MASSTPEGKTWLVAGASGIVGGGIVKVLLLADNAARVIVVARDRERLRRLFDAVSPAAASRIVVVIGHLDSEQRAQELRDAVVAAAGAHGIDHIVASLGSAWFKGPLTQQPLSELTTLIDNSVLPHFLFAKYFAPLVKDRAGATYTFITGGAADKCFYPDMSLLTVRNAAVCGIVSALMSEYEHAAVRINEVRIYMHIVHHENESSDQGRYSAHRIGHIIRRVAANAGLRQEILRLMAPKDFDALAQ